MKAPKRPGKELCLSQLPLGHSAVVRRLDLPTPVLSKLVEMGLGKGRKITYVQRAPMGDPMIIELMGYRLALRNREARSIWVTPSRAPIAKHPGKKPAAKPLSGKAA